MASNLWEVMEVISLKIARVKTENAMQEAQQNKWNKVK